MTTTFTTLLKSAAALVARASDPEFAAWRRNIVRLGGCTNPIHLVGGATVFDTTTGEALLSYGSAVYGGRLLTACGNRRATVCPACSGLYRADTYQLVRAGLVGGKNVTEAVSGHPRVFATLTAPGFGPVHTRREHAGRVRACRPRRAGEHCPHGIPARELLTAVTYVGGYERASGRRLRAFFGCLYYAAMRPGEALGLRLSDCTLPEKGWGRIDLAETRPTAGKAWTDSGEADDRRGLKQRADGEVRIVPIPPPLVRMLQDHVKEFGTAEDGRLFSSERGNVVAASSYSRTWKQARTLAFPPEQVSSVLAVRPYDLRHAGVSQWLNSGVPAPEVAARAGHSVDVLLKIYAKCVDGQEQEMNDRILKGLGEEDEAEE